MQTMTDGHRDRLNPVTVSLKALKDALLRYNMSATAENLLALDAAQAEYEVQRSAAHAALSGE